ncbi:MXAN_6640 family putative metalloprotease [Nocardioides donggukensis]|uniref:Uncharacterized protein n=1 Tax=Nocardioides donggukensis TaxID=2774019 RepID=A0A927K6Z5_9ACTN|nr:MXAN_6640 family putative metalloprotease [Nocardioides donggukensis]MBD8870158.1 hypothetical protein [Nocardioides donggukensis]
MRLPRPGRPARLALSVTVLPLLAGLVLASTTSASAMPDATTSDAVAPTVTPPAADPAHPGLPTLPDPAADQAEQALEQAEQALAGEGDLDPTLALAELASEVDDLEGRDRQQAEALFARPTDDGVEYGVPDDNYGDNPTRVICGEHVCVTRAKEGKERSGRRWAKTVLETFETAWADEVDRMGYLAPLPDDGPPSEGTDTKLDVYVARLSPELYGYAVPDDRYRRTSSAYLVVDNNYASFDADPVEVLQATAAHEFFHAIQFAYDRLEDPWFMESTATWIEDEVFDAVNDNVNFLAESSLAKPRLALDHPRTWYGNWVFFRFLTEREELGTGLVRAMWQRAVDTHSTKAVNRTLTSRGSSMAREFAAFSVVNNAPKKSYDEGHLYPTAGVTQKWTLGSSTRSTKEQSQGIRHLSSRNYRLVPDSALAPNWRLKITVNGPSDVSRASVLVHRRDGSLTRRVVDLGPKGNGTLRVDFAPDQVRKVSLNLANASLSYRCGTGGGYACNGTPRDDKRRFRFTARTVR